MCEREQGDAKEDLESSSSSLSSKQPMIKSRFF